MTTITAAVGAEHELMKLREEYVSMPGVCLNIQQAARLVGVDRECATRLLEELEAEGLLLRATGGIYRRSSPLMSQRKAALTQLASQLNAAAASARDQAKVRVLSSAVSDLANAQR